MDQLKKWKSKVKVFDSVASDLDTKKKYKINLYKFKDLKKFKFDAIILAVSHKEYLKKLVFYNRFFRNKRKKIFIDLKNNYYLYYLKKNNFKFFQL